MLQPHTLTLATLSRNTFPPYLLAVACIFLADAALAYTFPILLERALSSPFLMGSIMAFSSVIGIFCDTLFPKLFERWRWYELFLLGSATTLLFTLAVHTSTLLLPVLMGLIAVAIWGTYYELLGFSEDRYIVQTIARRHYTRTWATIAVVMLPIITLGPLLGELLLQTSMWTHTTTLFALQSIGIAIAFLLFKAMRRSEHHTHHTTIKTPTFSTFLRSFSHWKHLAIPLLPITLTVFAMRVIESLYWMFGALFAIELGGVFAHYAWAPLLLYTIPLGIGAIVLSQVNLQKNKRFIAHGALTFGGVSMFAGLLLANNPLLMALCLVAANTSLAFVLPTISAVSSGVQEFLDDRYQFYVVGMVRMAMSLGYIVGPFVGGLLAQTYSYQTAFMLAALFAVCAGLIMLFFSPRHIRIEKQAVTHMHHSKS